MYETNTAKICISSETLEYVILANGALSSPKLNRTTLLLGEKMYDLISLQDEKKGLPKYIDNLIFTLDNKVLDLPLSFRKNVLSYLQGKQGEKMDCHSFVASISKQITSVFDVVKYDENTAFDFSPGSLSYILDKKGKKVHSQVYLGGGVFLGKGGKKGPLMISTTAQMEILRGGVATYIQNNTQ